MSAAPDRPDTATTLDQLERLHAAATPGPWGLDFNEWMDGSRISAMEDDSDGCVCPEIAWNDAVLIVAAVNALPGLVKAFRVSLLSAEICGDFALIEELAAALSGEAQHDQETRR